MVPPGWFRLATSPTRDWVARDHEEGDELAPFQLIEEHSVPAGPALVCIELGVSMTAILLKNTVFQIDERSKFQTQKGLIFGLV